MGSHMTIRDIARLCGVGVSTVSRAVNGHPDVNEETRRRILDCIRQNGFVPNNSARSLKVSDSRTIALLIKGIANPFFAKMVQTFEEETKRQGYSLVVQHVRATADEAEEAVSLLREKRLRGLIFLGGYLSHMQERLSTIDVPFVLSTISIENELPEKLERAGEAVQKPDAKNGAQPRQISDAETGEIETQPVQYNQVSVDDVREAERMTEYLIGMGHRRIAILAADDLDDSVGKLRLCGYGRALKRHHIPVRSELIRSTKISEDVYTFENGYRSTEKLLESGEEFTAIFAISDTLAIGAVKALAVHGLRVPEDISVAGFDGLDLARFYIPSITTLRQPIEEIARETVRILFENMNQPDLPKKRLIFPGRIEEGGSVRRIACAQER